MIHILLDPISKYNLNEGVYSNILSKKKVIISFIVFITIIICISILIFLISDYVKAILSGSLLFSFYILILHTIFNAPIVISEDYIMVPKRTIIWYSKGIFINVNKIKEIESHSDWYYIKTDNKEYSVRKNKFFSNKEFENMVVSFSKRNNIPYID